MLANNTVCSKEQLQYATVIYVNIEELDSD